MFSGGGCSPCCGCTLEIAYATWQSLAAAPLQVSISGPYPRTVSLAVDLAPRPPVATGANPFIGLGQYTEWVQHASVIEPYSGYVRYASTSYTRSAFGIQPKEIIVVTMHVRAIPANQATQVSGSGEAASSKCSVSATLWFLIPTVINPVGFLGVTDARETVFNDRATPYFQFGSTVYMPAPYPDPLAEGQPAGALYPTIPPTAQVVSFTVQQA
jgi:hypothetical protein